SGPASGPSSAPASGRAAPPPASGPVSAPAPATPFWATPGGGVEHTESFTDAAIREAREELGLALAAPPPLAWTSAAEYETKGSWIHQIEQFFVVRVADGWSPQGIAEAHRAEGILAARFWTDEQIERTTEPIFPEDLRKRLQALSPAS